MPMLLVKSTQPCERDQRILDVVARVRPEAMIVQFLSDTPSQGEDIIVVLVDNDVVVRFELDRLDRSAAARDVTVDDVRTYARRAKGIVAKTLIEARALAKTEMNRRPR